MTNAMKRFYYAAMQAQVFKNPSRRILAIGLITAPPAIWLWDTPFTFQTKFGGSVEQLQSASATYPSRNGKVSPLCGCFKELPKKDWSGISLIREAYSTSFDDGDDPFYMVSISAPMPGPIESTSPTIFKAFNQFNAEYKGKKGAQHYTSHNDITFIAQGRINIRGPDGPLQIALLPPTGSKTDLSFKDKNSNVFIDSTTNKTKSVSFEYSPVIDLIGGDIEISFEKPLEKYISTIGVEESYLTLKSPFYKSNGIDTSEISKIYVSSPFSTRISFLGVQKVLEQQERGYKAVDWNNSILGKDFFNSNGNQWFAQNGGRLKIAADGVLSNEVYEDMSSKVDRSKSVKKLHQWSVSNPGADISIVYRMPFLAPQFGFQIYGDLTKLNLHGARGALTVGAKDVRFSAPSDIEFRNISPLRSSANYSSAPLSFDQTEGGELAFQATSEIAINGENVTSSSWTLGSLITALGAILGLLPSLIRQVQLIFGRKKTARETER